MTDTETADLEKTYDAIRYPGSSFQVTHPSHIGMVARLFGLQPADPQRCRVLEVGCAMGANLLPMAESLPESEFLGIDISGRQIAEAQSLAQECGLRNVELRHLDLRELDERIGEFDYIICHGIYSWVDAEVQQAILSLGKRHLTKNGLLLVSYNTLPGWSLRGAIRDMLLYHVREIEDPQQQIQHARSFMAFLEESKAGPSAAYEALISEESDKISKHRDPYFYHEHLGTQNHSIYFHEFVRRVDAAGLRYFADTSVATMLGQTFKGDAAERLKRLPLLRREQYLDFLCGRMFRSSLLCHQSQQAAYETPSANLPGLHVRLEYPLRIKREEEIGGGIEVTWDHRNGQMRTRDQMTRMMRHLNDSPRQWTAVSDLIEGQKDREALLGLLMASFVKQVTVFSYHPPELYSQVDDRPKCSAVTRIQARRGQSVTNRIHGNLLPQPQQRLFLSQMDGTKSRHDLATALCQAVAAGKLRFNSGNSSEPRGLDVTLAQQIVETEVARFRDELLLVE